MTTIAGVWLPIITPFVDGGVDLRSYERLLEHYLAKGVSGVFPVGTTGESPTLDDDEVDAMVERTVAVVAGRVPVFVGIGGNATHKVLKTLKRLARHRFDGIVSVCPYYNRPSQDGMLAHFTRIAEATDRPILIYNIPYRTSVNLTNDTLLRLAELPNIVGVKDSSGTLAQSVELLRRRPEGFARAVRRHPRAHDGQRPRRGARDVVPRRDARAAALQRGESNADQALSLAPGAHRLTGMPSAAHDDLRTARQRARSRVEGCGSLNSWTKVMNASMG
jgi:hypothetical protein